MEIDQNIPPQDPSKAQQNNNTLQSDSAQAWIPTKNPASLVSYYAGIFGLLPFVGLPATIVAIVAGVVALKKYMKHPTPGAKVHAIIGISLGVIQAIVFLLFIVSITL